jgi:hypothetical protein
MEGDQGEDQERGGVITSKKRLRIEEGTSNLFTSKKGRIKKKYFFFVVEVRN